LASPKPITEAQHIIDSTVRQKWFTPARNTGQDIRAGVLPMVRKWHAANTEDDRAVIQTSDNLQLGVSISDLPLVGAEGFQALHLSVGQPERSFPYQSPCRALIAPQGRNQSVARL
jgi:hypothetical protein